MRGIRTYWACPDEAAIARCFTETPEPVAAMAAARVIAEQRFAAARLQAEIDAKASDCTIIDIAEGEPVRNPRDWSDGRIWYPLRVTIAGWELPPPPECPKELATIIGLYDVSTLFDFGLTALAEADYAKGWRLYEYRWQMPQGIAARRPFTMPLWDGKFRAGMKLLAHTAQGYGDAIMFARYLSWLNDADCDLLSFDKLTPLLQTLNFKGRVMSHQDIRTEYDYHVPLCSLPLLLDPDCHEIPRAPYLRSDRDKYWAWRKRIGYGFNVGICWAGSEVHLKNGHRSMTLETVLRACPAGARLFSLQMGEPREQLKYLPDGVEITDWTGELYDWSDTAAMVDCLDLIVTVDTAVAHLAGALNRPVKLLLGDEPEWRWKPDVERGRSRWYSSVEIA